MMVDEGIFLRNCGKYRKKNREEFNLKYTETNKVTSQRTTEKNMIDRKKIIRDYKSTHTPMGIFQIKNNLSGCIYLGSSKNLKSSENRHIFQLQQNGHSNSELQTEWNKLGASFFSFEILDTLEPKEEMSYNYDDDLKTLFKLWKEKLTEDGKEVKLLVKHCRM
jgi:hypothetical protein